MNIKYLDGFGRILTLIVISLALQSPQAIADSPGGNFKSRVVVNSLADNPSPPKGEITLRYALSIISEAGKITFDRSLDGGTIQLTQAWTDHAVLPGEAYTNNVFSGYSDRDYGRSALYVRKRRITIDANRLPHGITIKWAGNPNAPARVLAVYGDLVMNNIIISSGSSSAEATGATAQPYTLARGGGLAVSGTAILTQCTISGNRADGDSNPSRDRGSFGGGIYGNVLILNDCVVSGNIVTGFGAAGGGIYSVGGAGTTSGPGSSLARCAITGNCIVGEHAYGGGVFSEGGGAGNLRTMSLQNCTVARNLVMDNAAIPEVAMFQYYYRGGGVYMSNGSLSIESCTIVENSVTGHTGTFSGKLNMGGGGIAATIGNAHVIDRIELWHSIVAGNTLNGEASDIFSGSLLDFMSYGYNRVGVLDFSQILVPVPLWNTTCRKHWPKAGDRDNVELAEIVSLNGISHHPDIISAGTDAGSYAVLSYPPAGDAVDQIPHQRYSVPIVFAEYNTINGKSDNVLNTVVQMLRTDYSAQLGSNFGSRFGDLSGIKFYPESATWPGDPANAPWIAFWHDLDTAIAGRLGPAGLNDDFWTAFKSRENEAGVLFSLTVPTRRVKLASEDEYGNDRPSGAAGDIGAIER